MFLPFLHINNISRISYNTDDEKSCIRKILSNSEKLQFLLLAVFVATTLLPHSAHIKLTGKNCYSYNIQTLNVIMQ